MTTTKLTKTEQQILDEIAQSSFGYAVVEHGVFKRRQYGVRRSAAASALYRAGLVRLERDVPHYDSTRGRVNVSYLWRVYRA